MLLSLISNMILVVGVCSGLAAVFLFCWGGLRAYTQEGKAKAINIVAICCFVLMSTMIGIGTSKYLSVEYRIVRTIATRVDPFVEAHPDSIYNPDTMLSTTDAAIKSTMQVLIDAPDVIKKLASGKTFEDINEARERAEFEAWKRSKSE
jgi:hypothetical protein